MNKHTQIWRLVQYETAPPHKSSPSFAFAEQLERIPHGSGNF